VPKFDRHIFICVNEREADHPRGCCRAKGSEALAAAFKEAVGRQNLTSQVRANKSQCLDQCEHGPTVVVYPEQVWYGFVRPGDVAEIIERHIVGGEPVRRLMLADDCVNALRCAHRAGPNSQGKKP